MDDTFDPDKRTLLKSALGVGGLVAGGGLMSSMAVVKQAHAQLLESGIPEDSTLAKIKQEGRLKVGYAQTLPWFQKSATEGGLNGIYYDLCQELGKALEIEMAYEETSWQNATIGLRSGDFDLFGSSMFYTVPRALVVNYVGPMWRKGRLLVTHKDFVSELPADWKGFNDPKWTFSITIGTSEEDWIRNTFPQANLITSTGQITLALEPVRRKQAQLFAAGDLDAILYADKNDWAHVIEKDNPIGLTPNTWAIRYGDPTFKAFLDFWGQHMLTSGWMQERYDFYVSKLT
jgi:polar amino acid transport system substrate-binding protein